LLRSLEKFLASNDPIAPFVRRVLQFSGIAKMVVNRRSEVFIWGSFSTILRFPFWISAAKMIPQPPWAKVQAHTSFPRSRLLLVLGDSRAL
jgi:hypothetical protein